MRRKARQSALQAIYQWQVTRDNTAEIVQQFQLEMTENGTIAAVDMDYFCDLVVGVVLQCDELDRCFSPFLSRPLSDVDLVDKAVLRLATYELLKRKDVPYRVVINEAIELAKSFAADDSHKFVNGVLDKIVKRLD